MAEKHLTKKEFNKALKKYGATEDDPNDLGCEPTLGPIDKEVLKKDKEKLRKRQEKS